MPYEWTEERRRRQAERCRAQRPWEQSTGPKSAEGKQRSSLNALKHGRHSRILAPYHDLIELNAAFLRQTQIVASMETARMVRARMHLKNELIKNHGKTTD